ncbi:hypothetical protein T12_3070 [Trichinella patagoniensis]|uniref:Uncharacterized protein n=1 Tax=Trichinella patagoniensis TaxID=990121 RepID=A0A0V0ZSN3_9BILA|nr:hypothetical protein T12_3070 [Trichinella patagoniensis]
MCQSYRPFIVKLLGNHCLNVVRETIQKKYQLCLKPEEELRELRNHYKNPDEDSVTHLRKEAKLGRLMRLYRKIGTDWAVPGLPIIQKVSHRFHGTFILHYIVHIPFVINRLFDVNHI